MAKKTKVQDKSIKLALPWEADVFKVHPVLKAYFGYCLQKSAQMMRVKLNDALRKEFHIVLPQYGILSVLQEAGMASQVELGDSLGIDKATMVKLIDGLEERKFVTREGSSKDRRVKLIQITEKGMKAKKEMFKIARKVEAEFLSPLTDQEAATLKSLIPKLVT